MRFCFLKYFIVFLLATAIGGCLQMIPGYRHEDWIKYSSKWVGHRVPLPFEISPSDPRDKLVKDVKIPNGDREVEFLLSVQGWGKCRYYYKYNPVTGEILGFRFVETAPGDCKSPV